MNTNHEVVKPYKSFEHVSYPGIIIYFITVILVGFAGGMISFSILAEGKLFFLITMIVGMSMGYLQTYLAYIFKIGSKIVAIISSFFLSFFWWLTYINYPNFLPINFQFNLASLWGPTVILLTTMPLLYYYSSRPYCLETQSWKKKFELAVPGSDTKVLEWLNGGDLEAFFQYMQDHRPEHSQRYKLHIFLGYSAKNKSTVDVRIFEYIYEDGKKNRERSIAFLSYPGSTESIWKRMSLNLNSFKENIL